MTSTDPSPVTAPAGPTVPGTRLHPIYLLTETARTVRRAIPFLVVTVLGGAPWTVNLALFALIMTVAVAEWSVRRYSVTAGVFRLSSGLLQRSTRSVPLSRITSVAANRSLVQRLVGTWTLRIGVPSDRRGPLISLPSLSTHRMRELHDALTADRPTVSTGTEPGPPDRPRPVLLARLPTAHLLVAAATSALIPVLVAASIVGWVWFSRFVPAVPRTFMETTVEPRGQAAVVSALVAVGLVAAVGWTVSRQFHWNVYRDGGLLHVSGGMLIDRTSTVEVARVHAVRIVEGLWRGRLGYCAVQAEVAGMGRVSPLRRTLFPLLPTDRVASFVQAAVPELGWRPAPLHRVPPELHRRYLTVPTAWAAGLAAAAVVGLLLLGVGPASFAGLAILPLGPLLAAVRAREAGWWIDDDVVVLQWRRVLSRQTVVARRGGIQFAHQQASPFNVRRGVSGVSVRFSSGRSAAVSYLPDAVVAELMAGVHRGRAPDPAAYGGR